ncbi:MAG: GxxExxY protein [Micropepsaceae bacterium]
MDAISDAIETVATQVVDAGLQVHAALGHGLLESVYEHCLAHEIGSRGLSVERQVQVPVSYKGTFLDAGFRLDLLVASRVVIEVKALDALLPIHQAQLMTYLRLSGHRVGFLMNFNVKLFKTGVRRLVM